MAIERTGIGEGFPPDHALMRDAVSRGDAVVYPRPPTKRYFRWFGEQSVWREHFDPEGVVPVCPDTFIWHTETGDVEWLDTWLKREKAAIVSPS